MAAKGVEGRAAFGDARALLGGLFGAAIGLAATLSARDPAMAFRGLLFAVAGTLAGIFVLKRICTRRAVRSRWPLHGRPHQGSGRR